jgi:nucleoside-diphosphate-sugar epimerase
VVFPGSRLQYGRVTTIPVGEDHPQRPTSLYGVHKLVGEEYYRLYHEVHGIMATCLRISNPYGPFQSRADREFGVVGTFIALALAGEAIRIYGGGRQLRDYVFVDDVIDVCIAAATKPAAIGQVFNVGGSSATTVREMAETVISVVGSGSVVDAPWPELEKAVETGDYVSDISRIRSVLDWEPTTSLAEGLARTVQVGLSAR